MLEEQGVKTSQGIFQKKQLLAGWFFVGKNLEFALQEL